MRDTIDMAHKAGFKEHNGLIYVTTINDDCAKELKAFEALVRADEQKKWQEQTVVEIHEAVLDERETCAKLIEAYIVPGMVREMARIIRARGTNDQ